MKNLLLTIIASLFIAGMGYGQSEDAGFVKKTTSKKIYKKHIKYLASDELAGRDVGTEGIEMAAAYIEGQLKAAGATPAPGLDGYRQHVPFKRVSPPTDGKMRIGGKTLSFPDDFLMLDGDNMDLETDYVFAQHGTEENLKGLDIKGKVVIAFCGDGEDESPRAWFGEAQAKKKRIAAAGGKGLVEIYQSARLPWKFLVQNLNRAQMGVDENAGNSLPHFWLSTEDKELVKSVRETEGKVSVSISGAKIQRFNSDNVVAIIEGSDPELKNEYVIYSAHYDHVGIGKAVEGDSIYNGARDNAVGTSAVLMAARNIGKKPTKRSALFILFTAEEKGLLGSRWFTEHSPIPLKDIVYCFNIDNGGYNDTEIITVIGLDRTTAGKHMSAAANTFGLGAIEDPAKEQGLFDRSDNVNFARKGIPAPTFSLGFRAFDAEIFKYYHQPSDDVESLDFNYLLKYCRSFVLSGRLIANDPERAFWMEGDKYYEAGKELYGKEAP